jgi:putative redox protein
VTTEVIYLGDLETRARHIRSGGTTITDAPVDNQGKGSTFSPTDLVAVALGSCILTIMGIKARDNKIDIKDATASVQKTMASDPRRIARLEVAVKMPEKKYSVKQKKLLETAAKGCPVANSLHPDLEQVIHFEWK